MDEVVAQSYKKLVEEGFKHAGSIESPSIFFDSRKEGLSVCGNGGTDYVNLYMTIHDNVIMDVRYLCSCDPVANVAVEAMCGLAQGKTLGAAKVMGKEDLYRVIGSSSGVIPRKVWGVLELLNQVIARYESGNTSTLEFEAAEWD